MEIKKIKEFWIRVDDEKNNTELMNKYNCSVERNNSSLNLYKGEWVKVTLNNYLTHIVKPVETLAQIAELYEVSKVDIMQKNGLETDKIYIGQQLKIYK